MDLRKDNSQTLDNLFNQNKKTIMEKNLMNLDGRLFIPGFKRMMLLANFALLFLVSACKKDLVNDQVNQDALASESAKFGLTNFGKADIVVHKGGSIQSAINAAKSGMVIQVEPGTYTEAVTISQPGIKLVGLTNSKGEGVVLQNPGSVETGITVQKGADGFSIQNFTLQNFSENGIFLNGINGFYIGNVHALNNGDYGIFPVFCSHGVIENCIANGHGDTGIYVGQSSDVIIRLNTVFDNVNGIEAENAHNISISFNNSYNNTLGIFADLLPGKTVTSASNITIRNNLVRNNNHPNFSDPNDLAAAVPSGVGILVLGVDQTTVQQNIVSGNNFTGIVVFSTLVLAALAGVPPEAFAGIEPNPDGTIVRDNILSKNGSAPPTLPIPVPGADLLWDGSGQNNCWSNNAFKTSFPATLPACN